MTSISDFHSHKPVIPISSRGFVLLKNNMWTKHLGKFLKTLIDNKININQGMMVQFSPKMVTQFLSGKDKTDVSSS